jgi:nucleoid DNA-binding protein
VFEVHVTAPRAARNPQAGVAVEVSAGKRVRFKPGRVMSLRVRPNPDASGAAPAAT